MLKNHYSERKMFLSDENNKQVRKVAAGRPSNYVA